MSMNTKTYLYDQIFPNFKGWIALQIRVITFLWIIPGIIILILSFFDSFNQLNHCPKDYVTFEELKELIPYTIRTLNRLKEETHSGTTCYNYVGLKKYVISINDIDPFVEFGGKLESIDDLPSKDKWAKYRSLDDFTIDKYSINGTIQRDFIPFVIFSYPLYILFSILYWGFKTKNSKSSTESLRSEKEELEKRLKEIEKKLGA
jgi:hypothetical protein